MMDHEHEIAARADDRQRRDPDHDQSRARCALAEMTVACRQSPRSRLLAFVPA
jgi:hypothetical protein